MIDNVKEFFSFKALTEDYLPWVSAGAIDITPEGIVSEGAMIQPPTPSSTGSLESGWGGAILSVRLNGSFLVC
jgi:hypothetical protein